MARVLGRWKLRPGPLAESAQTILSFSDRTPALVVQTLGKGRVATFLTGADMSCSSLPARPDWTPLMLNLASYAASVDEDCYNRICGEPLAVAGRELLPGASAELIGPDGQVAELPPGAGRGGGAWEFRQTGEAGFYTLRAGDSTIKWAMNPGGEDGDLSRTNEAGLRAGFGRSATLVTMVDAGLRSMHAKPATELGALLGVLLLVAVAGEGVLALWFGRIG